jgi:hypothetical protein
MTEVEWIDRDVFVIIPRWKRMVSIRLDQDVLDRLDKYVKTINMRLIQKGERTISRTYLITKIIETVINRPELLNEILGENSNRR